MSSFSFTKNMILFIYCVPSIFSLDKSILELLTYPQPEANLFLSSHNTVPLHLSHLGAAPIHLFALCFWFCCQPLYRHNVKTVQVELLADSLGSRMSTFVMSVVLTFLFKTLPLYPPLETTRPIASPPWGQLCALFRFGTFANLTGEQYFLSA